MKKIIANGFIFIFIMSVKLYCFDDILEDIFDDFEDLFQIVGIVAMIIIVMYFVKKFIKDDNNLNGRNENRNQNKGKENIRRINYDKKDGYKIIEYDKENEDDYDK